jgi:hypothetical protein
MYLYCTSLFLPESILSVIQKIVAGGPGRKTRLHTERNELIKAKELLHLPTVIFEKAYTLLAGQRPIKPWWPMSVIPVIDKVLTKNSEVLEFGSGSSTIWLARRAKSVIAVEDNPSWAKYVSSRLDGEQLDNANVVSASGEDYFDIGSITGHPFDLVIVDGSWRWKCVAAALPYMKPGGFVYLDNSDADKDASFYPVDDMRHEAQKIMENYAASNPSSKLDYYSSFLSGEIHAGEGMLLQVNLEQP